MKILRISIIALLFTFAGTTMQGQNAFFDETSTFLSENVKSGKVDYSSIAADRTELDKLVTMIADYNSIGKEKDLAFYLNAYNVLVIKSVVDNYPIKSPLDVPGFFDKTLHNVCGQEITLNGIENDIIRPVYGDARVHFALVCAAKGCPKIKGKAFTPSNYKLVLDGNTKAAMNDRAFIKVDEGNKTVQISKIFEWYKVDFGTTDQDLIDYINRYRDTPIPSDYALSYYEYDWSLNVQ